METVLTSIAIFMIASDYRSFNWDVLDIVAFSTIIAVMPTLLYLAYTLFPFTITIN